VKVDQAPFLVFRDLGVGQPGVFREVGGADGGGGGEFPAEPDGEAVPQVPGMALPQDGPAVVVGVRVDRRPHASVRAVVVFAAATWDGFAAAGGAPAVDRAEAGGGQGEEQPGFVGDGVGDGFAAGHASAGEVEGVCGVAVGAGRAHRLPAVAAGGVDGPGVVVEGAPGRRVGQRPVAGEVDRL
jgi:hypothetical protein